MLRFIALRILFVLPVVLGATIVIFVLLRLAPGDATQTLLGPNATEAAREALRQKLGLNEALPIQYWRWARLAVEGDLGRSIEMQAPVIEVVAERFQNTLLLGGTSGVLGLLIGISVGILSAVKMNGVFDRSALFLSTLGVSMPGYWLSVVLIYVFSVQLGWLPTGQMHSVTGERGGLDLIRHLVLPVIAALVVPAALMARFTRAALLEIITKDFLTGLRAKGLAERRVIYQHVIRNALPSIASMSGMQLGYQLLGQMLFIEIVFGWPGIGFQIYNAVAARDTPVIAGIVLLASVLFIFINLLMDVVAVLLTPRLRLGGELS